MLRPRPIFFLVAAYLVLGILYGTITPLFEAPDEQWHYAYVQHVALGKGLPEQSLPLQHLARQEGSQPPLYYLGAAALTFWIDTSDFPSLVWENPHYGYDVPGIVNDNKNLFIHTSQEKFPYRNTALAMHLARLLSLGMGALAVYLTYRITLTVTVATNPIRKGIALTAAALVAFTPQYLFISSAVSNDSTIVALSALALFLLVRAFRKPPTRFDALWIGAACGACAVAKVSGLAMLPLALLVLAYVNRRDARQLAQQLSIVVLAWMFVAGWWYARNLALYGELTGTARMLEIFGARANPLTWEQWRAQLQEVFETFWVGLGWGNIRAPEWAYGLAALGIGLGAAGLLLGMWRGRGAWRAMLTRHAPLLVLGAWVAIVFVSLVRWMTLTQAPHGRLLFPALPALAPLLVIGWMQLVPPRAQLAVTRAIPFALFFLALLAPFALLAPAYAYPPQLAEKQIGEIPARVDIRYGDKLMLLGSRVAPHPADPQGALQVDLYWRALAPMDTDYSLNLAALDETYRVIGSRTSYPGHGMLPTRLMQPGIVYHDTYWLPLTRSASRILLQISVFDRFTQENLPAFDPAGSEITPLVNTLER